MDRGYYTLLSHLYHPDTALALYTVRASIAHYLARLPQPPTSLAASVIGSPYFQRFSHAKLEALLDAHRHAVHLKIKLLQEEKGSIFSRGLHPRLSDWLKAIVEGFRGGHGVLSLVCCGGLLLGLEDLEGELHLGNGSVRRVVEENVVLALAEVMDTYSYVPYSTDWRKDFKSESEDGEEPLALSLLLASRFVPLVASQRLETLPLVVFSDLLTSTIESAFHGGRYLSHALSLAKAKHDDTRLVFDHASPFASTIRAMSSSKYIAAMATLSSFSARTLSVLTESRPSQGWPAMAQAMTRLEQSANVLEAGWLSSPLPLLSDESDVSNECHELLTQMWNLLKTQLFTTIKLSQAILFTVVFVPHTGSAPSSSPYSIVMAVLRTLSHLSFVIHQFGGVTATTATFPELKRTFYMALDVLSSSSCESDRFVTELCRSADVDGLPAPAVNARSAYVLACIEQLIPVLDDDCVQTAVFPLCLPRLSNTEHRETYESSHSVMLAVYAAYAQKTGQTTESTPNDSSAFLSRTVPFYTTCLLDNSGDGRLNTTQLCLAYAAVVRSATVLGQRTAHGDVLAGFCVEKLLDAIRRTGGPQLREIPSAQLQRLHRTLVATLPSVSLALLPWVLKECKTIITSLTDPSSHVDRMELVQALFREISESMGDAEKGYCLRWWYGNRSSLVAEPTASSIGKSVVTVSNTGAATARM